MSSFYNSDIYIIINTADITQETFNSVRLYFNVKGDIRRNSLKKSKDGTKTLLKMKHPMPLSLHNMNWYNKEEIRSALDGDDWS